MAITQLQRPERSLTIARASANWAWPLAVAGLLLGTILVRLPYLDVPISADEGGYATAAYWWARGQNLYQEITITRPQGIFVIFRAIEALGLGSTRGIHLFAAVWVALSAATLLAIGARLWGRPVGFAAAGLYAAMMAVPAVEGYHANAELFMTLPSLLSIWALLRAEGDLEHRRYRSVWLAASGVLGAVALLVKPSGIALLPLGALWLLYRWRDERATLRDGFAAIGALALGWLLGLLPALIHGLASAPERYLSAVIFYRVGQDSLLGSSLQHQYDYFSTNSLYVVAHIPLLLCAPFGLRLVAHGGDRQRWAFLNLWLVTAIGGVALGGNWFLHYYQQLLPPATIAIALAVKWLVQRPIALPRFAMACVIALTALPLIVPIIGNVSNGVDPQELPEWEPTVSAAAPIANYLAEHTTERDTIYVAYDHADMYYLSGRRPAARWLHFRELGRTPDAFAEQVARIADPATAPRYIVGAQVFDRWGFDPDGALRAVVARDYTLETTIEGTPLYRRNK